MAGMNMQQMMKQAKKMQAELEKVQESLSDVEVEATAGGGMVKVIVNGDTEVKSITIDPEAVDPEDVDMLQDMIMAAVNEGIRSAKEVANQRMGSVAGGMNLPF